MPKSLRGLFLLVILFTLFSTSVSQPSLASPAAQTENVQIVTDEETGLYTFIGINSSAANTALPGATALQNGTPTAATALADISIYAREFGLSNPTQELQFLRASEASGGSRSFRYQQVYQGVPVIGGELIANYNGRGMLAALVGETSARLSLSTTPRLPVDRATSQALGYVAKAEGVAVTDLTASAPVLSIFDPHLFTPDNYDPSLVWHLEVRSVNIKPIRYFVLVDAAFGGVTLAFNQIDTAWHGSAAAAQPQAVNPMVANLPIVAAPQFAPNFANPVGATYDSNGSDDLHGSGLSTLRCNTPPTALTGAGSCDGSGSATYANSAHYYAYNTFNYYDSHHVRNSINGTGMPLYSNVNFCDADPINGIFCPGGYANAFWDGTEMVYGDGAFFAADDVVAHELSHGVTEFSSGLFYFYESGAINESLSDVFGEFVDQSNGSGNDAAGVKWLVGEDVFPYGAARSMINPPAFGDPDRTQSALYYKNVGDNGGVHFNSGVNNKAAYLMAQGGTFNGFTITALGNDKTSAIYYEVNTNLLTSGSDYGILGAAIVQACNNILAGPNAIGMTPANCIEAGEATRATEMHLDPVAGVVFRPKADFCTTGNQLSTYLFQDDMESGFGNFSSGIIDGGNGMPANMAWQEAALAFGGPYSTSGTQAIFGANAPDGYGYPGVAVYRSYFEMDNGVTPPLGSTYYLHFNHSFALEYHPVRNYDGAVLEYELDGSNVWLDAGGLYEAGQNYNGTIYTGYGNPLSGRLGFVQQSHGYVSTRYNLTSLAGHSIRFRWVIGADDVESYYGWFLDDIQIYNCIAQNAAPIPQYTTDTTPELTWDGTTYATKYEVQFANNSAFTGAVLYTVNLPALSFSIPTPMDEGTYYWRVRAYDGVTAKPYSATQVIVIGS